MALANIVNGNITFQAGALSPSPLDVPLLAVTLTAPQDALWGSALIREVASDTWQDTLGDVGIVDGDPIYEYVQLTFSGDRQPRVLLLAKRATPVAQITNFDLGAAGAAVDGLYRHTVNGENYDVNAVTQTRAQVVTSMLAAYPGAQPVSAAAGGGSEDMDVSALAAGTPFVSAASAPAGDAWTVITTTPSVGMTTDLAAWEAERRDWYLVTRVEGWGFDEANAFAQSLASHTRDIVGWANTTDATDPDAATALTTRVAPRLAAFGYERLVVSHVPSATDFDWGRIIGDRMTTTPGSTTWANTQLQGVDGELWATGEASNLASGPYMYVDRIDSLGPSLAVSRNVRMVGGTGLNIDLIRGRDFLRATVQANVFSLLLREDSVDYTREGFGQVGAEIAAALQQFVASGFLVQFLADGTPGFVVNVPTVDSQTDADRAARIVRNFTFTAQIAGAIETVDPFEGVLTI